MLPLSYPGVYIQERSSGVKTITGVATSIGAFFGRSSKGYLNRAVRCFGYADFLRGFGGPHPASDLAASVRQFFDNGGSDCYVVRLADSTAQKAAVVLADFAGAPVLKASAKMEGVWGNGVRMEVDYKTPNPGATFNLTVIQEEGGREVAREQHTNLSMSSASPRYAPTFVSQNSALIDLELSAPPLPAAGFAGFSEARRPLGGNAAGVQAALDGLINPGGATPRRHSFDISVDDSAFVTVNLSTLTPVPATVAAIETALEGRINDRLATLVPARAVAVSLTQEAAANNQFFLRITASSPGGPDAAVRVRRAAANDLASALLLGADNGGVEMASLSELRPAPTGTVLRFDDGAGGLARLNALTGLTQDAFTTITVGTEPAVSLTAAPYKIQTKTAADFFYADNLPGDSPSNHNHGVMEKLDIIARAVTAAAGSRYRAEVQGYALVILAKDGTPNEQPSAVAFGGNAAAIALVNPAFQLNTRRYTLGTTGTSGFSSGGVDGNDGGAPAFADYVGDEVQKTGFHALDGVDLFNLMVLPADADVSAATRNQIWGPASIYCQSRRAFLLIDADSAWTDKQGRPTVVQNTTWIGDLRATVVKDYSAVFYPNVRFNDRGTVRSIGPAGAIAGLFARTDASRGVWKAPAGTEADLRGLVGLDAKLTDAENGVLNKLAVNCVRQFPSGFVNWGARTLDGSDDIGSEWKYIPIRRLALFIEESLFRGTQWIVFEPNDEPLWAKIRLNVGVFMNGLFRQGAFQGSSRDQAFYVKCDAETTTQADRNLGIVNIEVGFAPLKPAEFVVITIQQIAGDLQ